MEISGKTQPYPLHSVHAPAMGEKHGMRPAAALQEAAASESVNDGVDLSDNRNIIRKAIATAKAMPDVRCDRIAMIRQQLESGAYQVEAERVVSGLMTEAAENDSILKSIDENR